MCSWVLCPGSHRLQSWCWPGLGSHLRLGVHFQAHAVVGRTLFPAAGLMMLISSRSAEEKFHFYMLLKGFPD